MKLIDLFLYYTTIIRRRKKFMQKMLQDLRLKLTYSHDTSGCVTREKLGNYLVILLPIQSTDNAPIKAY